jgi:hypothetical protein
MVEPASVAQPAPTAADTATDVDEHDGSMRVLEWLLAVIALLAALGLAFLR